MDNTTSNSPKRITTKLKFVKSEQTDAIVSFISQNPKTGQIRGVRQDEQYPKKICVLDKKLVPEVLLNTLYDATLIPMSEKDGYVVIEITPVQFKASVVVSYIPKAIYTVEVKFGNKTVLFDPKDGKKDSVKKFDQCRRVLETRVDVKDLPQVLEDFDMSVMNILRKYEQDGFIYKW